MERIAELERTGKPAAVKTTLSVKASPVIRVCTIDSPPQVAAQHISHRLRSRRLTCQRYLQLILGKLTSNPSEGLPRASSAHIHPFLERHLRKHLFPLCRIDPVRKRTNKVRTQLGMHVGYPHAISPPPHEEENNGPPLTDILRILRVPLLVAPLCRITRRERNGGNAPADGDVGGAEGAREGEY